MPGATAWRAKEGMLATATTMNSTKPWRKMLERLRLIRTFQMYSVMKVFRYPKIRNKMTMAITRPKHSPMSTNPPARMSHKIVNTRLRMEKAIP